MTTKEIESKPGILSAQIVLDKIVKNNNKLWFIGNLFGTALLTVGVNNSYGIVAFTDFNIAHSFINRNRKLLLNNFGEHIVCANLSLMYLQTMLNPETVQILDNILINPALPTFFVPLKLTQVRSILQRSSANIDEDNFDSYDEEKLTHLVFNKETKQYEVHDHIDGFEGNNENF